MLHTDTDSALREVTLNVVYTRGTVETLLPFGLSLLQSPGVAVRLVGNGCTPDEMELISAVAAGEERLLAHALPYALPVEFGVALNDLFKAFPDPHFAMADSDLVATGDFMGSLGTLNPGQAGLFTAPPVWMTQAELDTREPIRSFSALRRHLPDGTYVGNTYLAIYDRAALEPAWRAAPLGFCSHHAGQLPRPLRKWLRERGCRFRWLDTARVVNLLLLLRDYELEERLVPELLHAGGYSITPFRGSRGGLRRAAAIIRSNPDGRRLRRLADGAATRLSARSRRDRRAAGPKRERRRLMLTYLDQVIGAVRAGQPPPPPPSTGSAEVDRRLANLGSAVEEQYPRGLATIRAASAAIARGPESA